MGRHAWRDAATRPPSPCLPCPQLHDATPQALLPVVPYISDELTAPSPAKRMEAVRLAGRLFGQRGGAAVAREWAVVLEGLLGRFADEKVRLRGGVRGRGRLCQSKTRCGERSRRGGGRGRRRMQP